MILERQGFADPRGNNRDNNEPARERVKAVIRYLVPRHGIELRQMRAVAMGKVALIAGKMPGTEALAKARRQPATLKMSPRPARDGDAFKNERPAKCRGANS